MKKPTEMKRAGKGFSMLLPIFDAARWTAVKGFRPVRIQGITPKEFLKRTKDRDVCPLPKWHDLRNHDTKKKMDALHALLRDASILEWSLRFPVVRVSRVEEEMKKAKKKAKEDALIRLGHLPKRKRGQPKGTKMSSHKKLSRTPSYKAASMLPAAERMLRDLYANQRPLCEMPPKTCNNYIRECALDVVAYLWLVWEGALKKIGVGVLVIEPQWDAEPIPIELPWDVDRRWDRHGELAKTLRNFSRRSQNSRQKQL
jgi:hypothetical protein